MYVVTTPPSFKKIHRRKREKMYCQFSFLCLCWRHKNRKTLMFYFERAQITWAFVISARAMVKLGSHHNANQVQRNQQHCLMTNIITARKSTAREQLCSWNGSSRFACKQATQDNHAYTPWSRANKATWFTGTCPVAYSSTQPTATGVSLSEPAPFECSGRTQRVLKSSLKIDRSTSLRGINPTNPVVVSRSQARAEDYRFRLNFKYIGIGLILSTLTTASNLIASTTFHHFWREGLSQGYLFHSWILYLYFCQRSSFVSFVRTNYCLI